MASQANFTEITQQDNEFLSILANQYCKSVLRYFSDASEETASIEELATAFSGKQDDVGKNHAAIQLHHVALPKLDDVGIIDYDTRSKTVRCHSLSQIEDWLVYDAKSESERTGVAG